MSKPLELTRAQILGYRRRVQALDERLPAGPGSLQQASGAGLQDSVPRSALHSLHARVRDVAADAWKDPALAQVWGPRYAAYVVPADAHLPFTLGRMPDRGRMPARAKDLADRAAAYLAGRRLKADDVANALGSGNAVRYATLTGRILIQWDGARQPTIWAVAPPTESPDTALQELLRRFLHVFGPSTVEAFGRWGGLDLPRAVAAADAIRDSLLQVRTPLGEALALAQDEATLRTPARDTGPARLLPSSDPYYLCWGADRELLVPDAKRRASLWTTRVWPGALLVGGEIAGTWRRSKAQVIVTAWRRLSEAERQAVEDEAATLPLPDVSVPVSVEWDQPEA